MGCGSVIMWRCDEVHLLSPFVDEEPRASATVLVHLQYWDSSDSPVAFAPVTLDVSHDLILNDTDFFGMYPKIPPGNHIARWMTNSSISDGLSNTHGERSRSPSTSRNRTSSDCSNASNTICRKGDPCNEVS